MKKQSSKPSKWISFVLWYVPILFVQILSVDVTAKAMSFWFKTLKKPCFLLSMKWLILIWIILYLFLAISVWLIYLQKYPLKSRFKAYTLFWIQLLLNGSWFFLFFYYQQIGWALGNLILLIVVAFIMIIHFFKLRVAAALLQFPYFTWVLYLLVLNTAFWILN